MQAAGFEEERALRPEQQRPPGWLWLEIERQLTRVPRWLQAQWSVLLAAKLLVPAPAPD